MIWIRNVRNGIDFHPQYVSSCPHSNWAGSAITIGGGYIWDEVYSVAASHGQVVVGGDEKVYPPIPASERRYITNNCCLTRLLALLGAIYRAVVTRL